ncbi:hypothetical protein E2C01_035183 [Portunus trituberculatus]|uniref:Uncharacterized protein n=1 Tax=Portunus trituberculatus TaxID=210409 RepID=A0A5B7F920_PORTR|nr:hypothetical protein [Portunus trituberculatus]
MEPQLSLTTSRLLLSSRVKSSVAPSAHLHTCTLRTSMVLYPNVHCVDIYETKVLCFSDRMRKGDIMSKLLYGNETERKVVNIKDLR